MILDWLTRDGKLLLSARIVRTFSYGFLSMILAIYLSLIGFDEILIGFILSATLVNSMNEKEDLYLISMKLIKNSYWNLILMS